MNPVIAPEALTISLISSTYRTSAIEHETYDDDSLYVTGQSFSYWVDLCREDQYLTISTYWDCVVGADEGELLAFTNDCNTRLAMVQFSHDPDGKRFNGHYIIPYAEGLLPTLIPRAGSMFASNFLAAIKLGMDDNLLFPWSGAEQAAQKSIH